MNKALNILESWSAENKLVVNTYKTMYQVLTLAKRREQIKKTN